MFCLGPKSEFKCSVSSAICLALGWSLWSDLPLTWPSATPCRVPGSVNGVVSCGRDLELEIHWMSSLTLRRPLRSENVAYAIL